MTKTRIISAIKTFIQEFNMCEHASKSTQDDSRVSRGRKDVSKR